MRVSVRKETTLCNKFKDFLRNGENKTELFIIITVLLAKYVVKKDHCCSSRGSNV